jgi:nucleoside phosphorylase
VVKDLIALVVALSQERRALTRSLPSIQRWRTRELRAEVGMLAGQAVVLIQAGIGRQRARSALLAASRHFPLRAAWSLGFAGGLVDDLSPGDLVCPAVVLRHDGRGGQLLDAAPDHARFRAALSAAGIPAREGPLLTVDAPLRTPQGKRDAHRRTGAVAVDMEAAGIAEAATELGIPWLAIKVVVDTVEDPLPEFLAGCTSPRGDLRWRGLLWSLVGSGERRGTLRRLGRATREASVTLRRAFAVAGRAFLL